MSVALIKPIRSIQKCCLNCLCSSSPKLLNWPPFYGYQCYVCIWSAACRGHRKSWKAATSSRGSAFPGHRQNTGSGTEVTLGPHPSTLWHQSNGDKRHYLEQAVPLNVVITNQGSWRGKGRPGLSEPLPIQQVLFDLQQITVSHEPAAI